MYSYPPPPRPLALRAFYVLLALSRRELHVYALRGALLNDSLGTVRVSIGQLYPLITQLHDEGLIDMLRPKPAGKSGRERVHYRLSKYGELRLKEEFQRLDHAMKIGEVAGLLDNEVPAEIERLLLGLEER